jgi:hypothetical protein
MPKKEVYKDWLQVSSLRVSRVRFAVLVAFAVSTIAGDAWNLIPAGTVLQRWTLLGIVAMINTVIWYASRTNVKSEFYYKVLIFAQIALDLVVVSLFVYSQRGIASRGVMLYALPLVTSAVLLTRSAVYAAATLCASAYALTCIRYQFLHPGEAYKVELYSELFFYGAAFFAIAALLHIVIRSKK